MPERLLFIGLVAIATSFAIQDVQGAYTAGHGDILVASGEPLRLRLVHWQTNRFATVVAKPRRQEEPAWSPDGNRLVFVGYSRSGRGGGGEIYTVGVKGSDLRRLTRNALADSEPKWSPDGRRIAFLEQAPLTQPGGRPANNVLVAQRHSGQIKRLTVEPQFRSDLRWSPSGRYLSFVVSSFLRRDLFIIDVQSGTQSHVSSGVTDASWSPRNDTLAFGAVAVSESRLMLFTVRMASTRVLNTFAKETVTQPSWAPNGRQIAFVRGDASGSHIEETDVETGQLSRITRRGSWFDTFPSYSLDGTHIALIRRGTAQARHGAYLAVVRRATRTIRVLRGGSQSELATFAPQWRPT